MEKLKNKIETTIIHDEVEIMKRKSDQGNVKRLDPPEEERRKYLKTVGTLVVGLAVGGAAGWLSKPAERVEVPGVTVTAPGATETVTKTVTAPITPTPTPTPGFVCDIDWRRFEGETISVAMEYEPMLDEVAKVIHEFTDLTGINVKYDRASMAEHDEKVFTDLVTAGGVYDVAHIPYFMLPKYIKGGLIEPINQFLDDPTLTDKEWFDYDDFPSGLQAAATYNGDIYGILIWDYCDHKIYIYRKDLFDEAGITEPPKTYDELYEIAGELHDPPDHYGYLGRGLKAFDVCEIWVGFLKGFGGDWFDEDMHPIFNSPEGVEALEFYADILHKYAPPGVAAYGWYETSEALMTGLSATAIEDTWMLPVAGWMEELCAPEVFQNLYAALMPKGPAGIRFPGGYANFWNITPYSKHKGAAWYFIQWYSSKEMTGRLPAEFGYPARTSTYLSDHFRELHGHVDNWIEVTAETVKMAEVSFPLIPEVMELLEYAGTACSQVIAGEKKAQEALDIAAAEVEKVMREAGYY